MPLLIKTTGLAEYAPGGSARVKVLNIGGPGCGKTRWASTFPSPIYADCEGGLASVADRAVPFVTISNSVDMLDLLSHMKQECRQPATNRKYQTIVIDTLDAFQRKVKLEWMEKEKKEFFSGWDAWNYLNARMQMLMTRLLNLDMNVIVNVHYKTKTTKDNDGNESQEIMLQLQGDSADTAFNDFDLVAWMGVYWEAVGGERVQKRGLTFTATPDKPFLKDRLYVTPKWLEVTFAPSDYTNLFERIQSRIEDLKEGAVVGEVPSATPDGPSATFIIPPGAVGTGPVAPTAPREIPFQQLDKPGLLKLARDKGISSTADGSPIRANTIKSELIAALDAHQRNTPPAGDGFVPTDTGWLAVEVIGGRKLPAEPEQEVKGPVANPQRTKAVGEGVVDVDTGELLDETETAIAVAADILGGTVISDQVMPVMPVVTTPPPAAVEVLTCADCGKDLANENSDIVKLSYIRFRKRYCEADYATHKAAKR